MKQVLWNKCYETRFRKRVLGNKLYETSCRKQVLWNKCWNKCYETSFMKQVLGNKCWNKRWNLGVTSVNYEKKTRTFGTVDPVRPIHLFWPVHFNVPRHHPGFEFILFARRPWATKTHHLVLHKSVDPPIFQSLNGTKGLGDKMENNSPSRRTVRPTRSPHCATCSCRWLQCSPPQTPPRPLSSKYQRYQKSVQKVYKKCTAVYNSVKK